MDQKEARERVENCRKDDVPKYKEAVRILAEVKEVEETEE